MNRHRSKSGRPFDSISRRLRNTPSGVNQSADRYLRTCRAPEARSWAEGAAIGPCSGGACGNDAAPRKRVGGFRLRLVNRSRKPVATAAPQTSTEAPATHGSDTAQASLELASNLIPGATVATAHRGRELEPHGPDSLSSFGSLVKRAARPGTANTARRKTCEFQRLCQKLFSATDKHTPQAVKHQIITAQIFFQLPNAFPPPEYLFQLLTFLL